MCLALLFKDWWWIFRNYQSAVNQNGIQSQTTKSQPELYDNMGDVSLLDSKLCYQGYFEYFLNIFWIFRQNTLNRFTYQLHHQAFKHWRLTSLFVRNYTAAVSSFSNIIQYGRTQPHVLHIILLKRSTSTVIDEVAFCHMDVMEHPVDVGEIH